LIALDNDFDFDFDDLLSRWRMRNAFTPKELAIVFWRLGVHNVHFQPNYFRVSIRRVHERYQLESLEKWKLLKIWPVLLSSQKQWCRTRRRDGNELPDSRVVMS
jgi:hypothetical protein